MSTFPFIAFEGIDACGKTTQIKRLETRILEQHPDLSVLSTFEPGHSPVGRYLREYVLHQKVSSRTSLLLFAADRADHVEKVLRPALEQCVVICDRYIHSTVAYQHYGQGLPLEQVEAVNAIATGGLIPDVVIFLDVDPMVSLNRIPMKMRDRFEQADMATLQRIWLGYRKMADENPGLFLRVDASQTEDAIAEEIFQRVSARFLFGDKQQIPPTTPSTAVLL